MFQVEEEDEEDVESEASGSDDDNISCMYITIIYTEYLLFHNIWDVIRYFWSIEVRIEIIGKNIQNRNVCKKKIN